MKGKQVDIVLLIVTIVLLSLGVIMVLSASAPYALNMYNDSYYFFKDQFIYAVVGVVMMLIISLIDYRIYKKFAKIGLIIGIVMIALVFVPGLGVTRNQATRWLDLGFFQFQPSELTKLAVILFFAAVLSQKKWRDKLASSPFWFVAFLFVPGIVSLILLKQPHMSAAVVIIVISVAIMFAAGAKIRYFMGLVPIGVAALVGMIAMAPYRLDRLKYWLDPWADLQGDGWQLAQSLMAVGSGGLFGLGLGQSRQKYMYLPEQYNDFIFAVWCEELGLIGGIFLIALFGIFIWRGIIIAMKCKDKFGSYMAVGITSMIGIQAIFNIAVVTGTIPVTGMSLPFFSYGGSSLIILLCATGILLNISRNCEK